MPVFLLMFGKLLPWQVWVVGLLVIGLIIGGVFLRDSYIKQGHEAAINEVNLANRKAQDNADKGVKSVADCYDNGGTWDRANGVCVGSGSGK